MSEPTGVQPEGVDPIADIQSIVARLDPSAMVVSVATVVEWLDDDGCRAMSVLHTPMAAWSLYGLLTYARDYHNAETHAVYVVDEDDDDDF